MSGIAADFLAKADADLDLASRQIRTICKSDFELVASAEGLQHGCLLHRVLVTFSRMMYADTQAVEGVNSLIRIISTRCRKITLELLSARVMLKYCLNYSAFFDTEEKAKSRSTVKLQINRGERLLEHIKPFKMAFRYDCSLTRWEAPAVADIVVSKAQVAAVQTESVVSKVDVWSASHATALRKLLFPKKKPGAEASTQPSPSPEQFAGWVLLHVTDRDRSHDIDDWFVYVNKHQYTLSFVEVVRQSQDDGCGDVKSVFSLAMPCSPISSTTIFSRYFQKCQKGRSLDISCVRVSSEFVAVTDSQTRTAAENPRDADLVLDLCRLNLDDRQVNKDILFTATSELNTHCNKCKSTSSTSVKSAVKDKSNSSNDDDGEDDDGSDAEVQAQNAKLETDLNEYGDTVDDDGSEHVEHDHDHVSTEEDAIAIHKRNLSTIRQAVKDGQCPAEAAVREISKGLCRQPQYATYSAADLEEEALVILIRGLSSSVDTSEQDQPENPEQPLRKQKASASATSNGSKLAAASSDSSASKPKPPAAAGATSSSSKAAAPSDSIFDPEPEPALESEGVVVPEPDPRITELAAHSAEVLEDTIAEDQELSSKETFSEALATKSRGAASGYDKPTPALLRNTARCELASRVNESLIKWMTEIKTTVGALQSMSDLRECEVGDNVSLVLLRPEAVGKPRETKTDTGPEISSPSQFEFDGCELMYVHWVRSRHRVARQVTLDDNGRVRFSMSFQFPDIHVTANNCVVIVPDVSVPMLKVTKPHRPEMPAHIRRIFDVYDNILRTCVNQDR